MYLPLFVGFFFFFLTNHSHRDNSITAGLYKAGVEFWKWKRCDQFSITLRTWCRGRPTASGADLFSKDQRVGKVCEAAIDAPRDDPSPSRRLCRHRLFRLFGFVFFFEGCILRRWVWQSLSTCWQITLCTSSFSWELDMRCEMSTGSRVLSGRDVIKQISNNSRGHKHFSKIIHAFSSNVLNPVSTCFACLKNSHYVGKILAGNCIQNVITVEKWFAHQQCLMAEVMKCVYTLLMRYWPSFTSRVHMYACITDVLPSSHFLCVVREAQGGTWMLL